MISTQVNLFLGRPSIKVRKCDSFDVNYLMAVYYGYGHSENYILLANSVFSNQQNINNIARYQSF